MALLGCECDACRELPDDVRAFLAHAEARILAGEPAVMVIPPDCEALYMGAHGALREHKFPHAAVFGISYHPEALARAARCTLDELGGRVAFLLICATDNDGRIPAWQAALLAASDGEFRRAPGAVVH